MSSSSGGGGSEQRDRTRGLSGVHSVNVQGEGENSSKVLWCIVSFLTRSFRMASSTKGDLVSTGGMTLVFIQRSLPIIICDSNRSL